MPSTGQPTDIEHRLATLEKRFALAVATLDEDVERLDKRIVRLEPTTTRARTSSRPTATAEETTARRASPQTLPKTTPVLAAAGTAQKLPAAGSPRQPLSDLFGRRVLAWVGGIATLTGIVLFLALAIARGWIGEEARVILASAVSSALMGGGVWLHDRWGRTEAAAVMVGAATAGLFAAIIVATQVYALLPVALALPAAMAVGALATALAVRWAGSAVGAIGLVGGLISPVLVGASPSAVTVAVLAITAVCATWVVVRTGWAWLGLASVLVCTPQWGTWLLQGQLVAADLTVLVCFTAIGLAAALGVQARAREERLRTPAAALATLGAFAAALVGRAALDGVAGSAIADAWLAALALAHIAIGAWRLRTITLSPQLRRLLIAIGVVLADVAFALTASGIPLLIGWGGAAAMFAWLARRTRRGGTDEVLVSVGLGAHLALALLRALIAAPPDALGAGDAQLVPLLSLSVVAASCLGSAHLVGVERSTWRGTLNALGLATIAYLTAATLSGPALVYAWAIEGLVLARIAQRSGDALACYAGFGFLGIASLHVLLVEAPPDGLVVGVPHIGSAAASLGAIAFTTLGVARLQRPASRLRAWMNAGAAAALLLLASIALITIFQPSAGAPSETVLDLSVRQQGQVLLSVVWTAVGLIALIVGLKRRQAALRSVALGWLMVTVVKVFLYDLATLTSLYRVVSFTVLGLLLLAGAFAYERLRPPSLPDMRAVQPTQP